VRTSSVVHLPCTPASVALARRALSSELRAAGVFDQAVRDAALVISELLSNAILHAYPLPGERLQVAWAMDGTSVEVAVSDGGSPSVPHAGHPSASSVTGRGLSIVEHLCQTWGIRTDELGLTVWAVLAAPRDQVAAEAGGRAPDGLPPDGRSPGSASSDDHAADGHAGGSAADLAREARLDEDGEPGGDWDPASAVAGFRLSAS
jgi:anti-sigma regulatory factor (Ser/Thr protein kinase)